MSGNKLNIEVKIFHYVSEILKGFVSSQYVGSCVVFYLIICLPT